MSYDYREISDEIQYQIPDNATEFFWIRLQDTLIKEIKDIPVEGDSIIGFWTHGAGQCDCVRHRAFYRTSDFDGVIPCGTERFILMGIWTPGGQQIYPLGDGNV